MLLGLCWHPRFGIIYGCLVREASKREEACLREATKIKFTDAFFYDFFKLSSGFL